MKGDFLFDVNRCTGCQACELACTIENALPWGESWRRVWSFNPAHRPQAPVFHLSLACNHCADAPCLPACPARAIGRDAHTGAVLIDAGKCMGCRYCSWVCPYDAPRFDADAGVMSKCTFCAPRLAEGREPACVALCPTEALEFAPAKLDAREAAEPESTAPTRAAPPGFPETGIRPAIRFAPLRREAPPDWRRFGAEAAPLDLPPSREGPPIGLAGEWPLLVFTLTASVLAAWLYARAAAGVALPPALFVTLGLAAPVLSLLHLGRPRRAWRAVLHLRRSWLSRELVFFGIFVAAGSGALVAGLGGRVTFALAIVSGYATLFAADRVYDGVAFKERRPPHSADSFLTGLFLSGVFAGWIFLALVTGLVKLLLYLGRHRPLPSGARRAGLILRLGLGFLLPALLWASGHDEARLAILAGVLAGELIDRGEFYLELKRLTPGGEMQRALAAAVGG